VPLVLEIEHLLGVAFAAQGPDSAAPDWPPQPDRVYSALVATWAARGQRPEERAALEWLERQPPPAVAASAAQARPAPTTFVPPNDPETKTAGDKTVLPALRRRQPRRFPAALPEDTTVRLVWAEADEAHLSALDALARDVAYVGHSASLTRCRFMAGAVDETRLRPARRRVYAGRLNELEAAFAAGRRPSPGEPVRAAPAPARPAASAFGEDWLVLQLAERAGAPDLRAAPVIAKAIRGCIMSGYGGIGAPIPEAVSGHRADGSPTAGRHLAVAPLAFVGFPHADGALHGFALVPPRGSALLADLDFRRALAAVAPLDDEGLTRTLTVRASERTPALRLVFGAEAETRSLDPRRYMTAARVWATATPVVLDRHLKADSPAERQREAEQLIAQACRNIGLPEPQVLAGSSGPTRPAVRLDKHSAVEGAPSAYPSGRAPRWTGWRVPEALRSRPRVHAVIRFAEPVQGPVILGAGRFVGLGLCLPLDGGEAGP